MIDIEQNNYRMILSDSMSWLAFGGSLRELVGQIQPKSTTQNGVCLPWWATYY